MIRRGGFAALALLFVLAATGCPASEPSPPASSSTSVARTAPTTESVGGRTKLAGFGEVTVTIIAADGTRRTVCLLLADVAALRDQGLMFVEDPELGGYDGMLFVFEGNDAGSFWMRNTRLALSIAWFRADGSLVSTRDMEPCPDSVANCPNYPAGEPYHYAIEVPAGRLDEMGIGEGSVLEVGATSCAPRP